MTHQNTTPITTHQLRAAVESLPKPTAEATTPYHQPVRGKDVLDAKVQLDVTHTPATHVVFERVPLPGAVSDDATVPTYAWCFTGPVQVDVADQVQVTPDNPLESVLQGVLTQAGAYECSDSRIIRVHLEEDLGGGLVTLTVFSD